MTRTGTSASHVIEPFDPARHDRAGFTCGVAQVDNFFRKTANKLSNADNVRVFVMVDSAGALVGFYAVNAHAVHYQDLPDRFARTRPGHGVIPAAYISMIGVDARHQGRGYGGDILVDCLRRLARAADELGIAVIMLDVLDCGNAAAVERRRALYTGYGFLPLPSNELRLFMPTATVRRLVDTTDQ